MVCNRAVADASAHSRAMVSSHSFPGRRFIRKPMEVCRLCHSLRCTGSIASPRVARPSSSGAGDEADRVSSSRRVGRGAFVGAIRRRCRARRGVCRVALGSGVAANGARGSKQVSGRRTVRTRLEAGGAVAGLRISESSRRRARLHRGPTTGATGRAWLCGFWGARSRAVTRFERPPATAFVATSQPEQTSGQPNRGERLGQSKRRGRRLGHV